MAPATDLQPLPHRPLLALDTGSPTVSVATVAADGTLLAERSVAQRESSRTLLRLVNEVLEEAGVTLAELGGVLALQGPGSFTGLRIGLATVQGFHQAVGIPATAIPTLPALAYQAFEADHEGPVLSVVDAVRGGWFVQPFRRDRDGAGVPRALADPQRREAEALPAVAAEHGCTLVWGFGAHRLEAAATWAEGTGFREPMPLAAAGARLALAAPELWHRDRLTAPLYLRAPAATLPKPRRPLPAALARS
jgi:tRNA threonylcarbamoyladenosine biosynthesis protein TsaB